MKSCFRKSLKLLLGTAYFFGKTRAQIELLLSQINKSGTQIKSTLSQIIGQPAQIKSNFTSNCDQFL